MGGGGGGGRRKEVVGSGSSLCPVESHSSRGEGLLCRCQELTYSPVEQLASSDDVRNCCIGTSVSCDEVGSVTMSAMY